MERIALRTPCDTLLDVWRTKRSIHRDSSPDRIIFFCHGSNTLCSATLPSMYADAKEDIEAGRLAIVAPEYRGFGACSNRHPVRERVAADVASIYTWLHQTGYLDPTRTVLYGHSGGAVVAMHAMVALNRHNQDSLPSAVAVAGAPVSLQEAMILTLPPGFAAMGLVPGDHMSVKGGASTLIKEMNTGPRNPAMWWVFEAESDSVVRSNQGKRIASILSHIRGSNRVRHIVEPKGTHKSIKMFGFRHLLSNW